MHFRITVKVRRILYCRALQVIAPRLRADKSVIVWINFLDDSLRANGLRACVNALSAMLQLPAREWQSRAICRIRNPLYSQADRFFRRLGEMRVSAVRGEALVANLKMGCALGVRSTQCAPLGFSPNVGFWEEAG